MYVRRMCLLVVVRVVFVGFVRFSLDVHGDHGVDCLGLFVLIYSLFVTASRGL